MSAVEVYESMEVNSQYREMSSSCEISVDTAHLPPLDVQSPNVVRPCYYILQILGMWKPNNGNFKFIWRLYRVFVFVFWLACLAAIICLDFVHYGFDTKNVHFGEILNSVPTCMNLLCPYVFTLYYVRRGQFIELVSSVQCVSFEWQRKLTLVSRWYTLGSIVLWLLGAAFFIIHWLPFLSAFWQYVLYILTAVYTTGWWAAWLSIYGFVCHVHSLQVDTLIEEMKSKECKPSTILRKHHQLQLSLERTQKDFNIVISFALAYHAADLIVFSFAYFNSSFGDEYQLWQYVGGVLFDLISIIVKLYPPAIVAAAVHRTVVQASRRCQLNVTPLITNLPIEDMQLFQYIALCESDMGLKILGIRITVELSMKILMTIVTAAISFVAFVVPRLK